MNASKRTESLKTWYNRVMTFFDNLKNKLFKEENGKRVKNDQSVGKSKDFQDKIKGLFAKKPDEVEQAVEDLDMSRENQETSRYQRSKQKKPIDTSKPLGKVQAFLSKFTLSPSYSSFLASLSYWQDSLYFSGYTGSDYRFLPLLHC